MKPRIRISRGIWYCGLYERYPGGFAAIHAPYGHGYTPAEAYRDWKAQQ